MAELRRILGGSRDVLLKTTFSALSMASFKSFSFIKGIFEVFEVNTRLFNELAASGRNDGSVDQLY